MKVLIVCNFSSGLYTFRAKLIQKLISDGNTVTAIVPQTSDAHELAAEEKLKSIGCTLCHLSMDRRSMNFVKDFGLFLGYLGVIREQKPDLIVTYTIKPNIYASLACQLINLVRTKKINYAVNITGLGTAFENEGLLKKLVCFLYKFALKNAKAVFFENTENRRTMLELGLLKENQAVVLAGAGVDLEIFNLRPYPTDEETIRFLFIGRVMREKGVDELFEAMGRLVKKGVNCKLDVVGLFEEDYSEKLSQYEKEGWLVYHGFQDDVRPFIENCHCFVLPSWHEGMANTNLECASVGRPVITSSIPGCMEAVVEGESGLLCIPQNADSLFEKIEGFSSLPYEERKKMGICGRKHMEKSFDKAMVVDMTVKNLY